MASALQPDPPRYPKRLRKAINYHGWEDDVEDETDDPSNEVVSKKRPKLTPASKKARPTPRSKIFPFLSLPAELRNRIYEHVLTDPKGHLIVSRRRRDRFSAEREHPVDFAGRTFQPGKSWWSGSQLKRRDKPAMAPHLLHKGHLNTVLLRVCKQMYDEAIGLLYSRPFVFADTIALHHFLTGVGPRMRTLLRDVSVKEWGYTTSSKSLNYPAMSLLADARNLVRLTLYIGRHHRRPTPAQIYRDCEVFFANWAITKGRKDAGIEILSMISSDDVEPFWADYYWAHKATEIQDMIAKLRDFTMAR